MKQQIFQFEDYDFNSTNGVACFVYFFSSGNKQIKFKEKLIFPKNYKQLKNTRKKIFERALFNLFLIVGISYYKIYCPEKIVINEKYQLGKEQAQFWNKVYTKGLGEFFYKNKIDFRNLVKFPYNKNINPRPIKIKIGNKSLVPLGGGKDSIVTLELLKKEKVNFDLFSLRDLKLIKEVAKVSGKKLITVDRKLDSQLFSSKKFYNGHIPFNAYLAFLTEAVAILYGYKEIVLSNEKSSSYGNVKYLGKTINHQWSKSKEFEEMFSAYSKKFITPSIKYYSLLRKMDELAITKEFIKHKKYFSVFSSCNQANFRLDGPQKKRWCGQCAKCVFTWTLLSAYLPEKKLEKIFGKNIYTDKKLKPLFVELLGKRKHKPFECVGTPEEMKRAMKLSGVAPLAMF